MRCSFLNWDPTSRDAENNAAQRHMARSMVEKKGRGNDVSSQEELIKTMGGEHPEEILPAMITVDEVAVLLRVHRNTIYELFRRREIPGGRRVGRNIRFSRDTVVQWISGNGRDSHSDWSQ